MYSSCMKFREKNTDKEYTKVQFLKKNAANFCLRLFFIHVVLSNFHTRF